MTKGRGESTVGDYLRYLLPKPIDARKVPTWPPDLFAVAMSLLQKSGAYTEILSAWPPVGEDDGCWADEIRRIGTEWRHSLQGKKCELPRKVSKWWSTLCGAGMQTDLHSIAQNPELLAALIQLAAASDEACVGFGIPGGEYGPTGTSEKNDEAFFNGQAQLAMWSRDAFRGSTLCKDIHHSKLRVLPKLHTPRAGLTVRSLSQYLCICNANEIVPNWCRMPIKHREDLNLLLVPWPEQIYPDQFYSIEQSGATIRNLPDGFGLFGYKALPIPSLAARLQSILTRAKDKVHDAPGLLNKIDGVIFPELALTAEDFAVASEIVRKHASFIVAGVAKLHCNSVQIDLKIDSGEKFPVPAQNKHHRWQLDGRQIERYGLDKQLDPKRLWWEDTGLQNRTINFIPLFDWLTMSVLICEDLARPDPVGDLLRAVGPNLVIALLMDGPQEDWRWSARYATALADDPGTSVLTLTSVGMTRLAGNPPRPADKRAPAADKIGLWKDARTGKAKSIGLLPGAEAVLLHITMQEEAEWTADGRSDQGTSCFPILERCIPVMADSSTGLPHTSKLRKK